MFTSVVSLISMLLPVALKLIGWILDKNSAKQATLDAFAKLVEESHNDGLISVQVKDGFAALDQKLKDELNKPKA